jgi:hypothetical protein
LRKRKSLYYLCGVVLRNQFKIMAIKPNKAYLINVADRTITDIEIRDWTQISLWIGEECEHFTCPISWANGDTIYADDEGLFHTINGGILVADLRQQILVGNVVVIGSDYRTGKSQDVKFTKEEISNLFSFINKETAEKYAGAVGGEGFIVSKN